MKTTKESWKSRFAHIPEGTAVLFFIQIFSTLGFAVLYSTLVLYVTRHLHFSAKEASAIMGVFGAFNYGLHLFGGYLGGRFLSNRNLFVDGMVLQLLGCGSIALGSMAAMYWGLALFLTGSGLNVTCINMMLTQRFAPEDQRRESAFLWNYAGMNIGFFIGFSVAGHYQGTEAYSPLFVFATVGNFLAIVLAVFNWKVLADRKTQLLESTNAQFRARFTIGIAILLGVPLVVWFMLQHTGPTGIVLKAVSGLVAAALIYLTMRHPQPSERKKMWAYLILTLGSLVFWSLYQMAPNGLQLFAVNNVRLRVWGIEVAPQWVQNINTVVIVVGGPLLAALFTRLRARGWKLDLPQQFAASLILMSLGFLALPVGIDFADASGRSPFFWLCASYVFQSIGELLISPIGYAMIGKLAPSKYQGIMMGTWMLVTGLASLFAGDFSGMVPEPTGTTAIATNPEYSKLFSRLGWGSFIAGVAMIALIRLLRKLIQNSPTPTQEAAEKASTSLCS